MCITPKEIEDIFDKKSAAITSNILDKVPGIINSVALTMQHKTAPETQKQLDETKDRLDKNDKDHQTLINLIESVVESQKQHGESFAKYEKLLISIDEGVKARGWIKRKFKEHWPSISIFLAASLTVIGYAIKGWIMSNIDKK